MKHKKLIRNGAIYLFGTVLNDQYIWDDDTGYFSSLMVIDALAEFSGDVTIYLNSGGGDPVEGEAIRSAIVAHPGKVTVKIMGAAHSSASLLAMAGDIIEMSVGSLMLVHDPALSTGGTARELRLAADYLDTMADTYATVYAERTGMSADEIRAIMLTDGVGVLYTPEMAVEAGFADAISGKVEVADVASMFKLAMTSWQSAVMKAKTATETQPNQNQLNSPNPAETNGVTMTLPKDNQPANPTPVAPVPEMNAPLDAAAITQAALTAQSAKRKAIMELATPVSAVIDMAVVETFIEDPAITVEMASGKILHMAAATHAPSSRGAVHTDERANKTARLTAAMTVKLGSGVHTDKTREFANHSIVEMAIEATGARVSGLGSYRAREDAIEMAMHGTSDFPLILGSAVNAVVEAAYALVTPTFAPLSRTKVFNDFRPHDIIRPESFPMLKKLGEHGEIKFGTFGEGQETIALGTYAAGLAITRQALINDETGAIQDVLDTAILSVPSFEELTWWNMFLSNPKMRDGTALFHADHGNLAAAATAITEASVSAGRKAMRIHKVGKGENARPVQLNGPQYIIVGPERETEVEKFLQTITAAKTGDVNIFSGKLEPLVTEMITDGKWFMSVGSEKQTHVMKHGYLDGNSAPRVRTEDVFGTEGMKMTLSHDFGVGAVNPMGAYKNG